eukprot:820185-Alexandrium_andersonii.AAC.1
MRAVRVPHSCLDCASCALCGEGPAFAFVVSGDACVPDLIGAFSIDVDHFRGAFRAVLQMACFSLCGSWPFNVRA